MTLVETSAAEICAPPPAARTAPGADRPSCGGIPPDAQAIREGSTLVHLRPRHAGGEAAVRVAWRIEGRPDAPCVAALGGISAHRIVAGGDGWWPQQTGASGALDTGRWRMLSIDWLDADALAAPAVDTADQAQALAGVLDALGIASLHALVGASYGAMTGLAFAVRFPRRLRRLVAIAGAHRAHPQAAALRAVQRGIVRLGSAPGQAEPALALARQLAMIGYRSPRELGRRFDAPPVLTAEGVRVAAQDWLDAAGERFVQRFDARRFIALSESIDLHRIEPHEVRVPTTLVAFSSDQLVPVADLCALQRGLSAPCELHVIDSDFGHDAFLKEHAALGRVLHEALHAPA